MNQAVFGEKAIHPRWPNVAGKRGDFTVYAWLELNLNASGPARNGYNGLTRTPTDGAGSYNDPNSASDPPAKISKYFARFGSWHPNMCQFAFGDGHVQAVNNYVGSGLIRNMSRRSDGGRVELSGM